MRLSYGRISQKLLGSKREDRSTGRIIIEVSEQFKKICNLQTFINPIVFSATAQAIIRRYRLLQEMDDLDVATFDDMMLDDVDDVTI